jgi:hypothetical protein
MYLSFLIFSSAKFHLDDEILNLIGCPYSAPDGSSPRGYLTLDDFLSIGCALSASDGSSPRGYCRVLVVGDRLKMLSSTNFFSPCSQQTLSGARSALPMGVAPEATFEYV